jgi:hypothetical protein
VSGLLLGVFVAWAETVVVSEWVEPGVMTAAGKYAGLLDNLELLPWDVWGAMPEPEGAVDVALFDELAAATAGPSMAEVRRLLADDRLRVPGEVFNVQHRRKEALT